MNTLMDWDDSLWLSRHNNLGPLHTPWTAWTETHEYQPQHKDWTDRYLLNDHGLMGEPMIEILE